MTLLDFIQQCCVAAIEQPCPNNAPTVWLLVQSRSGLRTIRRSFRTPDGESQSLDAWLDVVAKQITTEVTPLVPQPAEGTSRFRAVMVEGPYLPLALAVILPARQVPVLEAAMSEGPAVELPWLESGVNTGLGLRAFPRVHSIAASLLALAQRALIAAWN